MLICRDAVECLLRAHARRRSVQYVTRDMNIGWEELAGFLLYNEMEFILLSLIYMYCGYPSSSKKLSRLKLEVNKLQDGIVPKYVSAYIKTLDEYGLSMYSLISRKVDIDELQELMRMSDRFLESVCSIYLPKVEKYLAKVSVSKTYELSYIRVNLDRLPIVDRRKFNYGGYV